MFNQQSAQIIGLALEAGDKELVETLVCRECHFGWHSPPANELKTILEESSNRRLNEIAPWVDVARIVLQDERRILEANSFALKMIYGLPADRIMADFSIIQATPIDSELIRLCIPVFDGKRTHFASVDREGNLIIEEVIGRSPRPGHYLSARKIVDVIPAGRRTIQEVMDEKGFFTPGDCHKPYSACVSRRTRGCLDLGYPGYSQR